MTDYKKLFGNKDIILTNADRETLGAEVESVEYMAEYIKKKNRFVPPVDFSQPDNFARFGSAEKYYIDAVERIYKTYPYDGSLKERIDWELSSSHLDLHVFEKEYPRTNGYVILSSEGWGTQVASSDGYGATATASYEYIFTKGGPNTSYRAKGYDIENTSGDYKDGYANVWKPSKDRESNLKVDGIDGNTVEFWMKKSEFVTSKTGREVIFDATTSDFTSSDDQYGRLTLEMTGTTSGSPFILTYASGTDGINQVRVGSSVTTSSVADDSWHHYAFVMENSSSALSHKSVHYDSDASLDYVVDGDGSEYTFGDGTDDSPFSIAFWYKPDSNGGYLVSKYDDEGLGREYYVKVDSSNNNLQFELYDEDTKAYRTTQTITAIDDTSTWYHVVTTYDGRGGTNANLGMTTYINAVSQSTTLTSDGSYIAQWPVAGARLVLGAKDKIAAASDAINGYLTEVSIFNKELSSFEISTLYNGGNWTDQNNYVGGDPISWWRMGTNVLGSAPNYTIVDEMGLNNMQMTDFDGDAHSGVESVSPFSSETTGLAIKLYVDGKCDSTANVGTSINYVSGNINATIGSLIAAPKGTTQPTKGWGKLSGSLDEFRFWKKARNSQQIGRQYIQPVGGGTNTDDANTDLGVYYKFNEGITSTDSIDQTVLDYSGRISNGTFTGYNSSTRNTGSAMVQSGKVSSEFKDPILYPQHSSIAALKSNLSITGSVHDYKNNSSIYHSLPGWITEEDNSAINSPLRNLTQIIGSYFDTVANQIKTLPELKHKNYLSASYKPYPFSNRMLQSVGFTYFPELFSDASLLEQFRNRNDKKLF